MTGYPVTFLLFFVLFSTIIDRSFACRQHRHHQLNNGRGNHHAHPNWGYELGGSHMRRISQTYGPYSLKRDSEIPDGRPEPGKRLFVSQTVEGVINRVGSKIRDPGLAQIFANCLPSTLDTTVMYHHVINSSFPYTYIITGDIPAMWLRDSAYQVNPYVKLAKDDGALRDLILGVINTQAEMINIYAYGNAFLPLKHWDSELLPGQLFSGDDQVFPPYSADEVWEAKYELDSLASFLYLSKHYWEETGDTRCLENPNWLRAVEVVLNTMIHQQGGTIEVMANPPFTFTRSTRTQSETTNLYGIGNPVKRCGLIRSFFRPSDDSTIFQYLIPANAMAVVGLEGVASILDGHKARPRLSEKLKMLAAQVRESIQKYGIVQHPEFGPVYAYEVDCYGSHLFMDDANFPSLLSLPFYNYVPRDDPVYSNTRKYILSPEYNPYFASGPFPGTGSPHTGLQKTWHLGQAMQAFTSTNESEIVRMLTFLRKTTAGTGFMHESYNVDDPNQFSRSWFAWANTFFGDLILYLEQEYPHLLDIKF